MCPTNLGRQRRGGEKEGGEREGGEREGREEEGGKKGGTQTRITRCDGDGVMCEDERAGSHPEVLLELRHRLQSSYEATLLLKVDTEPLVHWIELVAKLYHKCRPWSVRVRVS